MQLVFKSVTDKLPVGNLIVTNGTVQITSLLDPQRGIDLEADTPTWRRYYSVIGRDTFLAMPKGKAALVMYMGSSLSLARAIRTIVRSTEGISEAGTRLRYILISPECRFEMREVIHRTAELYGRTDWVFDDLDQVIGLLTQPATAC